MGYLRKEADNSLLYTVVNQLDPDAEGLLSFFSLLESNIHTKSEIHSTKQIVLCFLQKRRLIKWT